MQPSECMCKDASAIFDLPSIHPSHRVVDHTQQLLLRHIHGNCQYIMDFGFGYNIKYASAPMQPFECMCKEASTIFDLPSIHPSLRVVDHTQQQLLLRHIHGNCQYIMDFGFGYNIKYASAPMQPSECMCKDASAIFDLPSIHPSLRVVDHTQQL